MAARFPGTMRARDEDRANTCTTLDRAFAQGQLSADEHTARICGRAGHDRNAAVAALDDAYADGQLGYEEHASRVSAARAAKTLADLHALTSDLQHIIDMPEPEPVQPRVGRARAWVVLGVVAAAVVAGVVLYAVSRGDGEASASTRRGSRADRAA